MRIIVFTGKGGVGKTSVAAATALRSAQLGYRTVVMSTDLAHSLADSLDVPLGPEPTPVVPNLWAQETDVYHNLETHWGTIKDWLEALMAWRGMDKLVADEMAVLPGMDELANLLWINRHRDSGNYDVAIVDAAPTGETLRLLSFPHVLGWWMERLFPLQRKAMGMARPLLRSFVDIPLPSDEVYASVAKLFGQLEELHRMMIDPGTSSIRLVFNAERMVVNEAQRTYLYLNLFQYPCDLAVCNRVIPAEVNDPFFAAWKEIQAKHLELASEAFRPLPLKQIPFFNDQVVGLSMLERMAEALHPDGEDPTQVFFRGQAHTIEPRDGGYRMTIMLPGSVKGDVSLRRVGDELFVKVGHYRRTIMLPRPLVRLEPGRAKLDDGVLQMQFSRANAEGVSQWKETKAPARR
ncbi:MAG: ArsA family ATPase [Chloroflexota bacterium]|nr:MAG: ArsA family ATPase [Chloroflexota bacterium]